MHQICVAYYVLDIVFIKKLSQVSVSAILMPSSHNHKRVIADAGIRAT